MFYLTIKSMCIEHTMSFYWKIVDPERVSSGETYVLPVTSITQIYCDFCCLQYVIVHECVVMYAIDSSTMK